MKTHYAGVLLPVTALPSPYGVGTLGKQAKDFIDFLVKAGQSLWQVFHRIISAKKVNFGATPYTTMKK